MCEVYQLGLIVHLKLNPDSVELIPNFIEDDSKKGHWGTGDLKVIIRNTDDFEKIQPLIDRAYNEN